MSSSLISLNSMTQGRRRFFASDLACLRNADYLGSNNLRNGAFFAGTANHIVEYPTPITLSYSWNFGSLSGVFLCIQIVTGVLLSMHYVPHVNFAFLSVELVIMREVNHGWLIRYMHSNGASFFFVVLYLHMARGIRYNLHVVNPAAWASGVVLYILIMGAAFLGYVLPWGQMSLWGATVITSLISTLPNDIGQEAMYWLWGGYTVNNATLERFYSLHFLLPLVATVVVMVHLAVLHRSGSSTPAGVYPLTRDDTTFYPYFFLKDMVGFCVIMPVYFFFVFFAPNYLGHPDNCTQADPMVTPPHIVPEWYFLPFYAMLRSVESKVWGVIIMGGAICGLWCLPLTRIYHRVLGDTTSKVVLYAFWVFAADFLLLGFLGAMPAEFPFVGISQTATLLYFVYLFLPLLLTLGFMCLDGSIARDLVKAREAASDSEAAWFVRYF